MKISNALSSPQQTLKPPLLPHRFKFNSLSGFSLHTNNQNQIVPCLIKSNPLQPSSFLGFSGNERFGFSFSRQLGSVCVNAVKGQSGGSENNVNIDEARDFPVRSSWFAGTPPSQFSSTFGGGREVLSHKNLMLPRRYRSSVLPRAAARDAFGFRLPVITVKPEWWWRTLACVPYLIALQISDVGFYLRPFSEQYELFENLVYFVPGAITRLPSWFTLIYCYIAYAGIVKNKEWPHFLRFHLMMGMLLETALQIVWYTCNFMPLIHYHGTFGVQFWAAIGFAYITVLLQCVRCALSGSYVDIPFVSDAAFIHTLFNIGSFHRPF